MSEIQTVEWEQFLTGHLAWEQGEHVTFIGPTGQGKTTLCLALLHLRDYVMVFATKPRDATMSSLVKEPGWRKVDKWERMPTVLGKSCKVVFWPKYRTPDDEPMQAWQIGTAMRNAFTQGGWCLVIDELWWTDNKLGLKAMTESLWTQGRSLGVSVVAGTQRPANVSLLAYDQPTHVFFWRDNDERNLKRISGMNGLNARLIRDTVATLPKFHVLYCNTRTGAMVITKAPARK